MRSHFWRPATARRRSPSARLRLSKLKHPRRRRSPTQPVHTQRPLLNVRLYKKPTFSTASIAMFFVAAALFGGMILLPLYWQSVRHESVIVAMLGAAFAFDD